MLRKDEGRSRVVRRARPDRDRKGHHAGALEGRGSVSCGSPHGANPRRAVTTDGPTGPHGGPSCDGGTPSEGTDPMGRLDPRIGTPEGPGSPGPTSRYGRLGDRPEARRRVRSPGVPVPHQLEGRVLGPEPTAGTVTRRSAARFVRLGGQQRIAAVDRTPDGPVTTHSSQTRDARSISASPAAPGRHGETRRGHATEGGPGHGDREPHGREWLKHVTGPGEDQAATAVENGGGGTTRVWKPAARWTRRGASGQPTAWSDRRDMDSPSLERRRGEEPKGRKAESDT